MKYLMAVLASVLSVWLFYFLVAAFFARFESLPFILVWLFSLILFIFSSSVAHVISRLFFLMAVETMVPPLAAFLHTVSSNEEFLRSLHREGQNPALIRYFIESGWDVEQIVMTALGFTLIFSVFAYFLAPERSP
ncbi:MAG: hypothetical protein AB1898_05055 [Acidobacteriota bacterium]